MLDTRAGFWLLGLDPGAAAARPGDLRSSWRSNDGARTYGDFLGSWRSAGSLLVPVLAITMLVTSEWSQRTGLVTFTLEPHRSRVVVAKFVAVLILAVAVIVLAIVCRRHRHAALGRDRPAATPTGTSTATGVRLVRSSASWHRFTMAFAYRPGLAEHPGLDRRSTSSSACSLPFIGLGIALRRASTGPRTSPVDRPRHRADAPTWATGRPPSRPPGSSDAGDRDLVVWVVLPFVLGLAPGDAGRAQVAPTSGPPVGGGGQPEPGPVFHGDDRTRLALD